MSSVKLSDGYLYYTEGGAVKRIPYSEKHLEWLQSRGHSLTPLLTMGGRLRIPLYPYQLTTLLVSKKNKGKLLLADAMGIGKTAQAIACTLALGCKKVLVLAPANVKYQWEREINNWLAKPPHIKVCEGQSFAATDYMFIKHSGIVIINYQIITYWVELLREFEWDLMIIDEAQKIKKPKAGCSLACSFVAEKAKAVMGLSGTPLTDRTADIWNVIRMIDKTIFPSEFAFQQRYCAGVVDERGRASVSANTLELHRILKDSGIMLRRTKADVYKQMPVVTTSVVPLDVNTRTLQDLEEEVVRQHHTFGHTTGKERGLAALGVQRSLEQYLQASIKAKLPLIIKWIEDWLEESDGKLLVSVVHREIAGAVLHRHFGARSLLIDGSISSKKKDEVVKKFCNDPEQRLLIGNILSVGTGTDGLQHVCSDLAVCEIPWSPADFWQLIARLDRNGQKAPVSVSILTVYGSADEFMASTITRKENIVSEVLDGKPLGAGKTLLDLMDGYVKGRGRK